MRENNYNTIQPENSVPIKAWTKGVAVEASAEKQLRNVASMPFIYKWVAAMLRAIVQRLAAQLCGLLIVQEALAPFCRSQCDTAAQAPLTSFICASRKFWICSRVGSSI